MYFAFSFIYFFLCSTPSRSLFTRTPRSTYSNFQPIPMHYSMPNKFQTRGWSGIKCSCVHSVRCNIDQMVKITCTSDNDSNVKIRVACIIWLAQDWFNLSPTSAAYMRQCIGSFLVHIMACRVIGTKPSFKPILGFCQLDILAIKIIAFFIKMQKICLHENVSEVSSAKWRPFCPGVDEFILCYVRWYVCTWVTMLPCLLFLPEYNVLFAHRMACRWICISQRYYLLRSHWSVFASSLVILMLHLWQSLIECVNKIITSIQ